MYRLTSGLAAIAIHLLLGAGCTGTPIGDPCVPESVPVDGFDSREIYLETSSVQCRTRVCMVYRLDGDPQNLCSDGDRPAGCLEREAVNSQVFCSCRCSVVDGADTNSPLCDCGDGFTCQPNVVTTGGEGVRGGYCVPCIESGDSRGLDPALFRVCPD